MQKHVINLVDLVKTFPKNIYLQNMASIQPRTSRSKFADISTPPWVISAALVAASTSTNNFINIKMRHVARMSGAGEAGALPGSPALSPPAGRENAALRQGL